MAQVFLRKLPLRKNDVIVFDGDSLTNRRTPPALDTWPYLRLMGWVRTYADRVSEFLFSYVPELQLRFHNVAIGGQSCRDLSRRLETAVLPLKPAWVIMTIGGNDAHRGIPSKEFAQAMERYLQQVQATSGGRVMVLGGFRATPHGPDRPAEVWQRRAEYDRILRRLTRRYDGCWVDAGGVLFRKATALVKSCPEHTVFSDGGHLNNVGSLILATEAVRALMSWTPAVKQ